MRVCWCVAAVQSPWHLRSVDQAVHARAAHHTVCTKHVGATTSCVACCLSCRFKRNGKKLVPSLHVIVKLMAPLLLWVAAVMVIYGVSYSNLQGLQGPLASLVRSSCLVLLRLVQPSSTKYSWWIAQHHALFVLDL